MIFLSVLRIAIILNIILFPFYFYYISFAFWHRGVSLLVLLWPGLSLNFFCISYIILKQKYDSNLKEPIFSILVKGILFLSTLLFLIYMIVWP